MVYEPPIAVYDANVLYPFHFRNLLIQFAVDRLVAARWSAAIHDEWIRNLASNSASVTRARLEKTRDLMNRVLPDADVTDHQASIEGLELPDRNDRHLLATAIHAKASRIVTWNTRDFPAKALSPHGIRAKQPDAFLLELYDAIPDVVVESTRNARRNLMKSDLAALEFVTVLRRQKVARFADILMQRIDEI